MDEMASSAEVLTALQELQKSLNEQRQTRAMNPTQLCKWKEPKSHISAAQHGLTLTNTFFNGSIHNKIFLKALNPNT